MLEMPNKHSLVGVLTRSRTLALQSISDLSFFGKPHLQHSPLPPGPTNTFNENSECHVASSSRRSDMQAQPWQGDFGHFDCGVNETSSGGNNSELDSKGSTRECRPNSLIRDAQVINTPGSTTRPTCSFAVNRADRTMQTAIPSTLEMEDFFAAFELHQQQLFLQRYNYDIVNDIPQPGRYEWVGVDN